MLDFETLSHVHRIEYYHICKVRIEYVSYRLLTVSSQPQSFQYKFLLVREFSVIFLGNGDVAVPVGLALPAVHIHRKLVSIVTGEVTQNTLRVFDCLPDLCSTYCRENFKPYNIYLHHINLSLCANTLLFIYASSICPLAMFFLHLGVVNIMLIILIYGLTHLQGIFITSLNTKK